MKDYIEDFWDTWKVPISSLVSCTGHFIYTSTLNLEETQVQLSDYVGNITEGVFVSN